MNSITYNVVTFSILISSMLCKTTNLRLIFSNLPIKLFSTNIMAKSKFEYVKAFESDSPLLPNCWIIVRIDGRNFHKFSNIHKFSKPNDARALSLMNRAAFEVLKEFKDVVLAYGQSDEYSFVIRKDTQLYNRRGTKLSSYINSLFSSAYVFHWRVYFEDELKYPPCFDSRVVLYPSDDNLKDYLSWRQADCHINNLYNTAFWALVLKDGISKTEAERILCGTVSSEKNELLFSRFGINYNDENVMFKKGTTMIRKRVQCADKQKVIVIPLHEDMIKMKFWEENPEILEMKPPGTYTICHMLTSELIELQLSPNR